MTASLLLCVLLLLPTQKELPKFDGPVGPPADKFTPDPSWKPLDKTNSLFFDPKDRSLILRARVCLREGYLEHLLCSEQTKEHESILATKATPKMILAGLILAGADKGHAVRFVPKFEAPTGTAIAITIEWTEDGKKKSIDAKQFVQDSQTKKPIETDWVFAGSELYPDPEDATKTLFAADGGDLFTVANFTSAILDLPINSSANDTARSFVANTEKLPPRNTYVTMILKPIKVAPKKP